MDRLVGNSICCLLTVSAMFAYAITQLINGFCDYSYEKCNRYIQIISKYLLYLVYLVDRFDF